MCTSIFMVSTLTSHSINVHQALKFAIPAIGHLSFASEVSNSWRPSLGRLRLKCDGTSTRNQISSSGETDESISIGGDVSSVDYWQPIVRISCSNVGYTMFRGSVKGTGYPLHSPVSSSLPLPCVTVCHHISTGVY